MYGKTIAEPGGLTARRAHHRRSAAVHAENGPGDRCGDMALTGPSHRSGKITATTHLPCPLAYTRGSALPTARHRIGRYAHSQQSAPGSPIAPIRQRSARLDGVLSLKVPKPVRVKYPCRARWPSWVSMFRGLTVGPGSARPLTHRPRPGQPSGILERTNPGRLRPGLRADPEWAQPGPDSLPDGRRRDAALPTSLPN